MTNFELNKKLAELMGGDVHFGLKARKVFIGDDEFNPCTNWSDIIPIAIELGQVRISAMVALDCYLAQISEADYHLAQISEADWEISSKGETPQIALVKCCIAVLESKLTNK